MICSMETRSPANVDCIGIGQAGFDACRQGDRVALLRATGGAAAKRHLACSSGSGPLGAIRRDRLALPFKRFNRAHS
jgi:hypothetical protein